MGGFDGLFENDDDGAPSHKSIIDMVNLDEELKVLPQMDLRDAVSNFVDKEENDAIRNFVEKTLSKTQTFCRKESQTQNLDDPHEDVLESMVSRHRDETNLRTKMRKEDDTQSQATARSQRSQAGTQ